MVVTWRTPHLGALEPDEKCMVQMSQQTNALFYLCAKSKGAQESGELSCHVGTPDVGRSKLSSVHGSVETSGWNQQYGEFQP